MADKKITELTEVSSLPDEALLTGVDTTRAAGDRNVSIQKSNLLSGGDTIYSADGTIADDFRNVIVPDTGFLQVGTTNTFLIIADAAAALQSGDCHVIATDGDLLDLKAGTSFKFDSATDPEIGQVLAATDTLGHVQWTTISGGGATLPYVRLVDTATPDALGDSGVDSTSAWNTALDALETAGGGTLDMSCADGLRFNITPETATERNYTNITITNIAGTGGVFVKDTTATTSQGRGVLVKMDADTTNFEISKLDILVSSGAFRSNFETGVICSVDGGLDNIRILNNTIKNESKLDTVLGVDGITIFRDTSNDADVATNSNITIEGNIIELYGNSIYGIQLTRETDVGYINKNNITLHAWDNFSAQAFNCIAVYDNSSNIRVTNNTVFGGGHSAIALSPSYNILVSGNQVSNVINPVEAGIEVEYKLSHGRATDTSHDIIIRDNFINNCNYGVWVTERDEDATTLAPYRVLIQGNNISNTLTTGIIVASEIASSPDFTSRIQDVNIDNNILNGTAGSGIRIYDAKDCSVTNNRVLGFVEGIVLGRDASIKITGDFIIDGNYTRDITNRGLWVESGEDVNMTVIGNKFYDGTYGVFMGVNIDPNSISTLQMIGNFVKDASVDGFYLRPSTDAGVILGNTALNCGAQGYDIALSNGLYTNNVSIGCPTADSFSGAGNVATGNKDL